jgi:hypothetical protein
MSTRSNNKPIQPVQPIQEHFWADAQVQRAIRTISKRYGLMRRADAIRLACVLVAEADGPLPVQQPPVSPKVGRPKVQRGH